MGTFGSRRATLPPALQPQMPLTEIPGIFFACFINFHIQSKIDSRTFWSGTSAAGGHITLDLAGISPFPIVRSLFARAEAGHPSAVEILESGNGIDWYSVRRLKWPNLELWSNVYGLGRPRLHIFCAPCLCLMHFILLFC